MYMKIIQMAVESLEKYGNGNSDEGSNLVENKFLSSQLECRKPC